METKLKLVQKPELIVVKGRAVSANGWHHYLVEEHLNWHLTQPESNKWCHVECMAKTIFQRNTPANCQKVRVRLPKLFRILLERHRLMVIDYSLKPREHRKIIGCKIFEATSAQLEQNAVLTQLERMEKRLNLSQALRERMLAIIGA